MKIRWCMKSWLGKTGGFLSKCIYNDCYNAYDDEKMQTEYGIATGLVKTDKCVYPKCTKNHRVIRGDLMVDVGIMGYRLHQACWRRLKAHLKAKRSRF